MPFYHYSNSTKPVQNLHCSCSTGKQKCTGQLDKPPMLRTNNGDTIVDVTGYDVNEYLLSTTDTYLKERLSQSVKLCFLELLFFDKKFSLFFLDFFNDSYYIRNLKKKKILSQKITQLNFWDI